MSKRKPFTSPSWENAKALITDEARAYARSNLDLIDMVQVTLRDQKLTQAELATKLGKSPSEVSKWLSPGHNMTMKTVTRLEVALGVSLLATPLRYRAQRESSILSTTLETDRYNILLEQSRNTFASQVTSQGLTWAGAIEETTINLDELMETTSGATANTPSYAMAA